MSNKTQEKSEVKKSKWSRKTKVYTLVLVTGLILAGAGSYYKNDKGSEQTAKNEDNESEVKVEDKTEVTTKNYLEGVLSSSVDSNLGTYKLASKEDGDIYLRTTRDFSKLLGSQVTVFINGTKDKFELVDIKSKVAGDSYILPQ